MGSLRVQGSWGTILFIRYTNVFPANLKVDNICLYAGDMLFFINEILNKNKTALNMFEKSEEVKTSRKFNSSQQHSNGEKTCFQIDSKKEERFTLRTPRAYM